MNAKLRSAAIDGASIAGLVTMACCGVGAILTEVAFLGWWSLLTAPLTLFVMYAGMTLFVEWKATR